MHCCRFVEPALSRRDMLLRCASGFGGLALSALMQEPSFGAALGRSGAGCRHAGPAGEIPWSPGPRTSPPRPRRSSSCSWTGVRRRWTPSTPSRGSIASMASRSRSRPIRPSSTTWGTSWLAPGSSADMARAASPSATCFPTSADASTTWRSSGRWSPTSPSTRRANYFIHTGSGLQGRPSHGAWVTYGLGSECQDLPGFVVLNGGLIPPGGMDCFNSGFLPAAYQGSVFKPAAAPIANIAPTEPTADQQRRQARRCCGSLDRGVLGRMGHHDSLEAAISNYELAFRMQSSVPELVSPRRRVRGNPEAVWPG